MCIRDRRATPHGYPHLNTFESLHLMIAGTQMVTLVSPKYARHLYLDFPHKECSQVGRERAFGSEGLGGYAHGPIDYSDIHITEFPKLREVELHTALIHSGDALFVPAFWLEKIDHMPTGETHAHRGNGRNIAVTYTQQRTWHKRASMLPLAADVIAAANRIDHGPFQPGSDSAGGPDEVPGTPRSQADDL